MDRRDYVLATLSAGGEHTSFSPAQVQKLFFLIDREIPQWVGGPHFRFEPYDYTVWKRILRAVAALRRTEPGPSGVFV